MAAGGCRATTIFGKKLSDLFDLSIDSSMPANSTTCKRCDHTLSHHDDLPSRADKAAGKLLSMLISIVGNLLIHHSGLPKASL